VLFVDIAGSIGLAERLGATQFGELLERYYQDVTDIIFQYGGLLDKYLGDGVMAVFGMGGKGQPEEQAVTAAIEILRQLESRYRGEGRQVDVGIGINTGSVVAGYVSTKERVELTVLGDAVNVAAGLQQLARPNRILLGAQTAEQVKAKFKLKDLGPMSIKDRSKEIQVSEVLSK
jgi:class 3 adenylate cyclase